MISNVWITAKIEVIAITGDQSALIVLGDWVPSGKERWTNPNGFQLTLHDANFKIKAKSPEEDLLTPNESPTPNREWTK